MAKQVGNEPRHIFHHYFRNLPSSWGSHGCGRAGLFGQLEDHPVPKSYQKGNASFSIIGY